MRRGVTAFLVATVGTAAFGGTAQAASLTAASPKPCYLSGETTIVDGAGFTPDGNVNATFAGLSTTLFADPTGAIGLQLLFPRVKGVKTFAVTATDMTNPALTATLNLAATRLHVDVNPADAKAGKKLRLKGSGFVGGKKVFMHVRGPHHYRSDTRIATTRGPCGTFKTRRRIVPAGARAGVYAVHFDAKKKFSKKTEPQFDGTLTVTKTFG